MIRRDHAFDIAPLWHWLRRNARLPGDAKRTSNIVSSVWGIYAQTEATDRGALTAEARRRRGVWQVLWECHRATVTGQAEAQFLVEFGKAISHSRTRLREVTRELTAATRAYLAGLETHLSQLRQLTSDRWPKTWKNGQLTPRRWSRAALNLDLPGPHVLREMATQFRMVDSVLANLHTNVTRRVSAPFPIALPPRPGRRERHLLKKVERILRNAGFTEVEIADLFLDQGGNVNGPSRVHERKRLPRHRRRMA